MSRAVKTAGATAGESGCRQYQGLSAGFTLQDRPSCSARANDCHQSADTASLMMLHDRFRWPVLRGYVDEQSLKPISTDHGQCP